MNNSEFSAQFDILYDSITSNKAPALDEYEKSVFLTLAEYDVTKAYYTNKSNKLREGFDESENMDILFKELIKEESIDIEESIYSFLFDTDNAISVSYPHRCLSIINESIKVSRGEAIKNLTVTPLNHNEVSRITKKPYRWPFKRSAWKYISDDSIIIIPGPEDVIQKYYVRYLIRPYPIILTKLDQDHSIDSEIEERECELNESLHTDILKRAVELAKAAYMGDLNTQLALSQISQTNLGMIQQSK